MTVGTEASSVHISDMSDFEQISSDDDNDPEQQPKDGWSDIVSD